MGHAIEDVTEVKLEEEPNSAVPSENDESFIEPRLPRMMTPEEIEVFKKELFAKYFPTKDDQT